MDAKELIAELRSLIEGARSMPMSSSAVVNRSEVLDIVGRLEDAVSTGSAMPEQGDRSPADDGSADRAEPRALAEEAERERERLVSDSEVFRVAKIEAEKEIAAAKREAEALRKETDDYVDTRLATFEITLTRTLEAVSRGRARLHGRSHFEALGETADGSEGPSGDVLTTPDELRQSGHDQGA